MDIVYRHVLPYPRERVWSGLLDFDLLSRTVPGVEALEPIGENRCDLRVKVGVPLVTGTYRGTVEVVSKNPCDSYRLRGEAKGRLGWVKGEAGFRLGDSDGGTEVVAELTLQAGGVLAAVGQRMMEGIGKSMAREFFAAFERELKEARSSPE